MFNRMIVFLFNATKHFLNHLAIVSLREFQEIESLRSI